MINNRLFKKINSIFWGILTWLPVFILILSSIIYNFEPQIDNQITVGTFLSQFVNGAYEIMSNNADLWFNPLSEIFNSLFGLLDTVGSGSFYEASYILASWVCWVQVIRLLVYVFYWFIDLISGLFDLMTFNRKGDN